MRSVWITTSASAPLAGWMAGRAKSAQLAAPRTLAQELDEDAIGGERKAGNCPNHRYQESIHNTLSQSSLFHLFQSSLFCCSAVLLLFCCSAALSIVSRWHSVEDCPERIRAKVRQFGVRVCDYRHLLF